MSIIFTLQTLLEFYQLLPLMSIFGSRIQLKIQSQSSHLLSLLQSVPLHVSHDLDSFTGNYSVALRTSLSLGLSDVPPALFKNEFLKKIFYLFLAVLGLYCCLHFSLVVVSGAYCLVAMSRLCTAVLLLLRRTASWCMDFRSCNSRALGHQPNCSEACGIFLGQESNLCLLHCQVDSSH